MPRNASGVYVQPASDVNPPIAGTVIDPVAFSAAVVDLGNELTNSLDRLGRAPMQAILAMAGFRIQNVGSPINPTDAARLMDFGGYLPPGAIGFFSQKIAPAGWLVADGSAISRTTYAALFAVYNADGLIYGVGDGTTTFNLPNYQGAGFRSWDNGRGLDPARVFGSYQADMFAAHTHIQNSHTHAITDPTHQHSDHEALATSGASGVAVGVGASPAATGFAATGITINAATAVNQNTGSVETVGKNYAILTCIRI